MRISTFIRNSFITVGLTLLPTHKPYTHWTPLLLNTVHQQYLLQNYERVVAEQEQKFGFTFSSVPNYFYEFKEDPWYPGEACYDPESGNILFTLSDAYEAEISNSLRIPKKKKQKTIEETVRHELGHDYFFERAKYFETYNYWNIPVGCTKEEFEAIVKLREGVAKYVETKYSAEGDTHGLPFVKPILDINFKNGIDWIVTHPPLPHEWGNLVLYQQRGIRGLTHTF